MPSGPRRPIKTLGAPSASAETQQFSTNPSSQRDEASLRAQISTVKVRPPPRRPHRHYPDAPASALMDCSSPDDI